MRTIFAILVGLAQLALLIYMAGEREWVLRTGQSIYLRTAPVDPHDPMRGDYVRFNYEVSRIPRRLCRDEITDWFALNERDRFHFALRDRRVYAQLSLDSRRVGEVISLSNRKPPEGLFLVGRVNEVYSESVSVRFGIEAFFTQQGKAKALEDTMRAEKAGVPLDMEIAVSPKGLAVLKDYRWEQLGLTFVLDRVPPTPRGGGPTERPGPKGVSVELKNHGNDPIAVVIGADGAGFRLLPREERFASEFYTWSWVGANDPRPKARPEDVKVLKPGESYRIHLDFTDAKWFLRKINVGKNELETALSMEKLGTDWNASFRIEYADPSAEDCLDLPQSNLIKHLKVRSRAFTPAGSAD